MAGRQFGSLPVYNGHSVVLDNDPRLSASTIHTARVLVDFGHAGGGSDTIITVTVPATWVTATNSFECHPATATTADHGSLDAAAEGIWAYVTNIVAATSFDLITVAPTGTWGRYYIDVVAY